MVLLRRGITGCQGEQFRRSSPRWVTRAASAVVRAVDGVDTRQAAAWKSAAAMIIIDGSPRRQGHRDGTTSIVRSAGSALLSVVDGRDNPALGEGGVQVRSRAGITVAPDDPGRQLARSRCQQSRARTGLCDLAASVCELRISKRRSGHHHADQDQRWPLPASEPLLLEAENLRRRRLPQVGPPGTAVCRRSR